ncbi:MAG: hypothetical protein IM592_16245 [Bacteroidetes bacterium]|nr:hypothetical protein [Bacteroidota bacterium]
MPFGYSVTLRSLSYFSLALVCSGQAALSAFVLFAHYVRSSLITLATQRIHRLPTFWRTCWRPSATGLIELFFNGKPLCSAYFFAT